MLDRLLGLLGGGAPAAREQPSEQLSVALLLLELARSDFDFAEVEQARIRELLGRRYGLGPEQLQDLMERAQGAEREAVSLYDYVRTINERFDPAGKYQLMEMLWQVAWADGRLDPHEEHLLRKLAGLLYVSDADYIRAKLAVMEGPSRPG
ncbi:MAG TPA: TerB family tellurite resistance protein [Nevskia sp.]|nr:TerB family tellurite resistance protein [Nevskia sp.]